MGERTRWAVVALVGVVCVIVAVGLTVWTVDGGAPASSARVTTVRPGATSPGETLNAYAYRTSSRFGEQVVVSVDRGTVSVTGPRLDRAVYYGFVGLLMLTWAAVPVALAAAILFRRWRWLWWIPVAFLANWLVALVGAAALWELPNVSSISAPGGLTRVSFPASSVRDVTVGPGWSRNGIGIAIWPFVLPVDGLAKGHAVTFEAPSGDSGRYVVYALHFYTPAEAARFRTLLGR